jgi:succinoglycan biosynthesis transport protein ExoP
LEPSEFLLLVRRRLALILIFTSIGLSIAIILTSRMTPMFESTATVFVATPPTMTGTLQGSGNELGDLNTGNSFTQARVKSYATIVNNPTTINRVINELGLEMSVKDLSSSVSASAPSGTVLMYISAKNEDPILAAKIANSVAENFADTVLSIELNSNIDLDQIIKLSTVREAEPNIDPVSPRKLFNYLLGLFAGSFLALFISLLLRYLDKSMKSEKDLGETPLLGVVEFDFEASGKPLITSLGTYALRTEAFRVFRTNLLHVLDEKSENCIAISSCFSGEGKTTSTLNLGFTIAQAGFSVVVVEADMRRSSIQKYLSQAGMQFESPNIGLSDLLMIDSHPKILRKIKEATLTAPGSNLNLILGGKSPENPAEILGSDRFVDLLTKLKSQYDYVIVDTPPILAVADAAIIGRVADVSILILHAGETSKRNFEAARSALNSVGVQMSGVLLNKVPKHKAGETYGYTYSDPKSGYYRYSYDYKPSRESEEHQKPSKRLFSLGKEKKEEDLGNNRNEGAAKDESFEELLKRFDKK